MPAPDLRGCCAKRTCRPLSSSKNPARPPEGRRIRGERHSGETSRRGSGVARCRGSHYRQSRDSRPVVSVARRRSRIRRERPDPPVYGPEFVGKRHPDGGHDRCRRSPRPRPAARTRSRKETADVSVIALVCCCPDGAAGILHTDALAQSRKLTAPESFTANAQVTGAQGASATVVGMKIDRYSADADRDAVTQALKDGGYPAFLTALRKAPVVGTVTFAGETFNIRWARQQTVPNRRVIVLVTEKPMFFVGGGSMRMRSRARAMTSRSSSSRWTMAASASTARWWPRRGSKLVVKPSSR